MLNHRDKMSDERHESLIAELSNLCGPSFDSKNLQLEYDNIKDNCGKSVCAEVVSEIISLDQMEDFILMWRRHFVDNFYPEYMPDDWAVDNSIKIEYIDELV